MSPVALAVLAAAALSTAWLLFYVLVKLPNEIDARLRTSLRAYAKAVELRCPAHLNNSDRVIPLSIELGKRLGLSRRRLIELEMAATLRDIGICTVPYRHINESDTVAWLVDDLDLMIEHPPAGAAILEQIPSLRSLADIVRYHHAPFCPQGGQYFPSGQAIPLESRLLNVVTSYVLLEQVVGSEMAESRLRQASGVTLDPSLVELFLVMLTSADAAHQIAPMGIPT